MKNQAKKIAPLGETRESVNKKNLQEDYTSQEVKNQPKRRKAQDQRSRNWTFLAWSLEAIKKIREFLKENPNIKCAISPVHDQDVIRDEQGNIVSPKKIHWHVIFIFVNKMSWIQVETLIKQFGCEYPKPIGTMINSAFNNLVDATRYLTHADHPFIKKTYEPNDIEGINGYEVKELFTAPLKERNVLEDEKKIMDILRNNHIESFREAVDFIKDEYYYLYPTLSRRNGIFFKYTGWGYKQSTYNNNNLQGQQETQENNLKDKENKDNLRKEGQENNNKTDEQGQKKEDDEGSGKKNE